MIGTMAQALSNHFFVDNIDSDHLPERWRMGKLGEILELKYGTALKEKQRKEGRDLSATTDSLI